LFFVVLTRKVTSKFWCKFQKWINWFLVGGIQRAQTSATQCNVLHNSKGYRRILMKLLGYIRSGLSQKLFLFGGTQTA
jgi:hypothetical protein